MRPLYRIHRSSRKSVALILALLLLWSCCFPFVAAQAAADDPAVKAGELAAKAVDFIHGKGQNGESIDGYTAATLIAAKEDLSAAKWTPPYSISVKGQLLAEADALTIGHEVGSSNNLITYLLANQNADGSFGPYANEYGTKVNIEALARIKDDLPAGALKERVVQALAKGGGFLRDRYAQSRETYSNGGFATFDARFVASLTLAGADLAQSPWLRDGKTLRDQAVSDAVYAAENPAGRSATELAKHLTALSLLQPGHEKIDLLGNAIRGQQQTVGDSVYFGASIYDDVAVLSALGQGNQLGDIDPVKALAYLNMYRTAHSDDWGTPAGVAYGSYSPEEPELTAQVLSALSGFTHGRDVDAAVADIETYLKSIQRKDTAAIPVSGDSSTTTAETLIALKRLGLTFDQYARVDTGWAKEPPVKPLALSLLAMEALKEGDRANRLADMLLARHSPQQGFSNSIYSDGWAYLALGEAGKNGTIKDDARAYLLGKQQQNGVDKGAWGESFGSVFYPDFMATAQAIRSLKSLPAVDNDTDVQQAIADGLAYLKSKQQVDGGGFGGPYDDPVVDTAELVITMKKMALNPADLKDSNQHSPVDWMLTKALNDDGSFGGSRNVFGATEALAAYLALGAQLNGGGTGGGTGGPTDPQGDSAEVNVAVIGPAGEKLFGPATVTVRRDGRWGMTALGTLEGASVSYTERSGFVTAIAGQSNQGLSGWMFKVNNVTPMMAAKDKAIKGGDKVIWWYSVDMNNTGPTWSDVVSGKNLGGGQTGGAVPAGVNEQNSRLPKALQVTNKAIEALENLKKDAPMAQATPLAAAGPQLALLQVVGEYRPLSDQAYQQQQRELTENRVALQQEVKADQGAVLADAKGEIALAVPANALSGDTKLTIQEIAAPSSTDPSAQQAPSGFAFLSPTYRFGPDGTTFAKPVTVAWRVALPPAVKPEDLALAVFEEKTKAWMRLPAVFDGTKGVFLAQLPHFSDYALMVKKSVETVPAAANKVQAVFVDLAGFEWAAESIRRLSDADILRGVAPDRFEPQRTVTRAEFAALLVRCRQLPATGQANFRDVQPDDWYAPPVAAAVQAGIVKGDPDGAFRPVDPVTREEMAVMVGKALHWQTEESAAISFIDQESLSPWARPWVAQAVRLGLLRGYADGSFQPQAKANRAEAAALVDKLMKQTPAAKSN